MKRTLALLLCLALLCACAPTLAEGSERYKAITARFNGQLEKGVVVNVLENNTAIELGYVQQLIDAFNEAFPPRSWTSTSTAIWQPTALTATARTYGIRPTTFS